MPLVSSVARLGTFVRVRWRAPLVRMSPLSLFFPSPNLFPVKPRGRYLETHCWLGSDPGGSTTFGLVLAGLKLSRRASPSPVDQGSPVPAWSVKGKRYSFRHFTFRSLAPSGQTTHGPKQGVFVLLLCFTAVWFWLYIFSVLEGSIWFCILLFVIAIFMFGLSLSPTLIAYVLFTGPPASLRGSGWQEKRRGWCNKTIMKTTGLSLAVTWSLIKRML
jgi:hypothetical protein